MKSLPPWLIVVIGGLVAGGFATMGYACLTLGVSALDGITAGTGLLTLGALLAYVYYTYWLDAEAWMPSASHALQQIPELPSHILFIATNSCKRALRCWCKLNATVLGQKVELGGFYSAQSPMDLQPFGSIKGHFSIKDVLAKANQRVEGMRTSRGGNDRLRLDIEFWYHPINLESWTVHNPRERHYFEFSIDKMVVDV